MLVSISSSAAEGKAGWKFTTTLLSYYHNIPTGNETGDVEVAEKTFLVFILDVQADTGASNKTFPKARKLLS